MKGEFVSDIEDIRRRARKHIEQAAITDNYGANPQVVIQLLNEALATEIVCNLRYRRHYFMATGIHSREVAMEFLEHANQEAQHADWLAERITQLDGEPDFDPVGIEKRSHAEYKAGDDLADMIKEDLVAERIAIESYLDMIRFIGEGDPTSRRLLERILEVEEEHARDMADLLERQTH